MSLCLYQAGSICGHKYGLRQVLPVPVHILANELANGGCTITGTSTKKISTIRSRHLSIAVSSRTCHRCRTAIPQTSGRKLSLCDTQLFLGCTDEMTAEFISNRTGEVSGCFQSGKAVKYLAGIRLHRNTGKPIPSESVS